ncbi:MAG: hypothetical protein L6Q92_11370 [Phycisphaerae bacterium]|nr:hypothetical protein [Phycisphaerae bacterium]
MFEHHADEFTVTDLRHTLGEAWRIVRNRRRWLIVPFLLVTSGAFGLSMLWPRSYSVSTSFDRRRDLVLANMGKGWTDAVESVRATMASDLRRPALWISALAALDLPLRNAGRDVPATPIAARRSAYAARLLSEFNVAIDELGTDAERVTLSLSGRDATDYPAVLTRVRDAYIREAQQRMNGVLVEVRDFFEKQAAEAQRKCDAIEQQVAQMICDYPGVDDASAETIQRELQKLHDEDASLRNEINGVEGKIAEARTAYDEATAAKANPTMRAVRPAASQTVVPNPHVARLVADLDTVQRDLSEARQVRRMTEEHPTVIALREKIDAIQIALSKTPATIAVPVASAPPTVQVDAGDDEPLRLQRTLAGLTRRRAALEQRRADVLGRIDALHAEQVEAAAQKPTFASLESQLAAARGEVAVWKQNIEPINRVLTVQHGNRGVLFSIAKNPATVVTPTSPAAKTALTFCLVVGVVVGLASMLLSEVADRSFRSVGQIGKAIGVPVLEAIDEIVTQADRRRKLLQRVVVLPAMYAVLVLTLVGSGALAYRTLTRPAQLRPAIAAAPIIAGQLTFAEPVGDAVTPGHD